MTLPQRKRNTETSGKVELNCREPFDPGLLHSFDIAERAVPRQLVDPSRVRLNKERLRLSGDGLFYTIQGEGTSMGKVAVFVRLHVCNLRCTWCDTYYTWNPESMEFWTESFEMTVPEVAAKAEQLWACRNPRVPKKLVITGGEPLLQKELLDTLIDSLPSWQVEIETNGTIMPTKKQLRRCQFNCSPKLANSGNYKESRIRPDVLRSINGANSQFKFVVSSESDVIEIERDFSSYMDYEKIVLMPQGVTAEEISENMSRVVESAKSAGIRIMSRMHIEMWGTKRGV